MLGAGCLVLGAGCWVLGAGCMYFRVPLPGGVRGGLKAVQGSRFKVNGMSNVEYRM